MSDNTVRAGEYVLGVLGPEERVALEREAAADPTLAAEIMFWNERFAPLTEGMEVEPPAGLFVRIKNAIAANAGRAGAAQDTPATAPDMAGADDVPGTLTMRADAGPWERLGRGIERRILHTTPTGRCTYLIRGQPGARLPEHDHDDDEEIYVVEGDLTIGTLALRVGDYHLARRGYHHPVATSQNGCLLLVTSLAA
jgi:quercetin dioxygenase-like cupin family protein